MLELKDAPVVKVNAERTALMNAQEHAVVAALEGVKIHVRADAVTDVQVVPIIAQNNVVTDVLAYAVMPARMDAV